MTPNLMAFGYLIAALCFISALSSMTSEAARRQAVTIAIIGLVIALFLTLFNLPNASVGKAFLMLLALAFGGGIGVVGVMKIETTAMPQLLAASQSLVGMATVLIAITALINPHHVGITDPEGRIYDASLFEMGLAAALGAITFSGSITAAGKLGGILAPVPINVSLRNVLSIGLGFAAFLLLIIFMATGSYLAFSAMTLLAFVIGFILLISIDRIDMPILMSMLNGCSAFAVASIGFTFNIPMMIITGAVVGSSSSILAHRMCRATNRSLSAVLQGDQAPIVADSFISDQRAGAEGIEEPPSN